MNHHRKRKILASGMSITQSLLQKQLPLELFQYSRTTYNDCMGRLKADDDRITMELLKFEFQ